MKNYPGGKELTIYESAQEILVLITLLSNEASCKPVQKCTDWPDPSTLTYTKYGCGIQKANKTMILSDKLTFDFNYDPNLINQT